MHSIGMADAPLNHDRGLIPDSVRFSTRRLTRLYPVALVFLAALALAEQWILQGLIEQQRNNALVINLAGRQRMLSQRLVKDALALVAVRDIGLQRHYHAELSVTLERWQKTQ